MTPRPDGLILHDLDPKGCHCFGTGLILMDDQRDTSFAEPCPMCPVGMQRSGEYVTWSSGSLPPMEAKDGLVRRERIKPTSEWRNRNGYPITQASYYHHVEVTALTWNNGLTVFHRFGCATIGCDRYVTSASERCAACVPCEPDQVIPTTAAITAAKKAKASGDERTLFDLARVMERQMRDRMRTARAADLEARAAQAAVNTINDERDAA